MNGFYKLTKRNVKLFIKDRGMLFCSLITPLILLVLYATFLSNIFKDSYVSMLPEGVEVADKILNGLAGGQLLASLLSVSCVTVAFCANMVMVQDKLNGARKDILMTGVKSSTLSFSYYISSLFTTLIISLCATVVAWIYLACIGWFLSFVDCLLILFDVFVITMFGTVLSSIINYFLTSQGQVSAVGTIVSSMYGFICGAYMPIASFGTGLQKVLMFLPSTYATSLLKNHCMNGALLEFQKASGLSDEVFRTIKQSLDCELHFFGTEVSQLAMFGVLIGTTLLLLTAYILINKYRKKRKINY